MAAFTDTLVAQILPTETETIIKRGWLFKWYPFFYLSYGLYVLYNVISPFKIIPKNEKKRVAYFLSGVILAVIFGVITNLALPLIGVTDFIFIGPYSILIFITLTAYAILKHDLMDIKLVIPKIAAYSITLAFLLASVIFPIFYINNKFFLLTAIGFLATFWAFSFLPLSNFLITTAKRKFIKGYYESNKLLANLADQINNQSDRKTIFLAVEKMLSDAFELENSAIIVAERNSSNQLNNYLLIDEVSNIETEFLQNNTFIAFFQDNPDFCFIKDLPAELELDAIRSQYSSKALALPFKSPEIIEGIIILGERSSRKPLSDQDFDFIKQIYTLLSAVLFKLTPYEKIQAEFEANQKKLYNTERHLARSEKIASLAHLIQEYNHEIKTPLAILVGAIHQLPKTIDDTSEFKATAFKYTEKIGDIVRTTLRLSSTKQSPKSLINLNHIVNLTLDSFPLDGISIEKNLQRLPDIQGSPDDLQIVFTNLIKNAQEAMPDGGIITIKTYSDKENIFAEISDSGCGISKKNYEKIFEPFFSTHVTKGRGLGLSVVFRIIREHLAQVQVSSKINKGSTFIIKFPVEKRT